MLKCPIIPPWIPCPFHGAGECASCAGRRAGKKVNFRAADAAFANVDALSALIAAQSDLNALNDARHNDAFYSALSQNLAAELLSSLLSGMFTRVALC